MGFYPRTSQTIAPLPLLLLHPPLPHIFQNKNCHPSIFASSSSIPFVLTSCPHVEWRSCFHALGQTFYSLYRAPFQIELNISLFSRSLYSLLFSSLLTVVCLPSFTVTSLSTVRSISHPISASLEKKIHRGVNHSQLSHSLGSH